jgi:hypothetical protein
VTWNDLARPRQLGGLAARPATTTISGTLAVPNIAARHWRTTERGMAQQCQNRRHSTSVNTCVATTGMGYVAGAYRQSIGGLNGKTLSSINYEHDRHAGRHHRRPEGTFCWRTCSAWAAPRPVQLTNT